MRILAVGSMYPPHSLGGYELAWQGADRHLRERGHEVRVLASDFRREGVAEIEQPGVHRELRWYWRDHGFPRLGPRAIVALERHNGAVLQRHLAEFAPDVVAWWAMGGMSLTLIERVRRAGLPAAGFVSDDWMLYGPRVDAWSRLCGHAGPARALIERLLGIPASVDLGAAGEWAFVSEHVRQRAEATGGLSRVSTAHTGVDPALFPPAPERPWGWRLLYTGRLDERKGIHTAVEALELLAGERGPTGAVPELEIVGAGDPGYAERLRALVEDRGLAGRVSFSERRHEELPPVYAAADAIVFPVEWDEPWGLVPLEAMAVGRPVVATGTGGSAEYLREGENCLLFEPGNAAELAAALRRLAADPALRAQLREGGFRTAAVHTERSFNEKVEEALLRAGSGA